MKMNGIQTDPVVNGKKFIDNRDLSHHINENGHRRMYPIAFDVSQSLIKTLNSVDKIVWDNWQDAIIKSYGPPRTHGGIDNQYLLVYNKALAKKLLTTPNIKLVNEKISSDHIEEQIEKQN